MNDLEPFNDTETAAKDIRVIVKVKNANILRMMEERGIKSVSELARLVGIGQGYLGTIINMKIRARKAWADNPEWREVATKLSKFFRCLPEDLFSERQQFSELQTNTASRDVSSREIEALLFDHHAVDTPEQIELRNDGMRVLNQLLLRLTPREQRIINLRFGLDGKGERTLDKCAKMYDVGRERIRQIESKALRKLKHKASKNKLKPHVVDIAGFEPREDD